MDDRQFDDIVKNKLESLTPPYREDAWKALDFRLDLLAPLPWYSRWKSLLVASSLGVITLLNIGLLYKVDSDQNQLKQLLKEISVVNRGVSGVDTVYIVTENYLGTSFLTNSNGLAVSSSTGRNTLDFLDPLTIYMITASAADYSTTVSEVGGQTELPSASDSSPISWELDRPVTSVRPLDPFDQDYNMSALNGDEMYVRGVVLPPSKKKWDHPLDPRIGMSFGYLIPDPDVGERFVTSRLSLLFETPVRGNFHLLSGLSFQEVTYKLDDVDDNNFERTTLLKYPGFGSFSTSPDEIKVENKMLQIPLYFRYYKPLNRNWWVFAGGGPTVDILLNQKFTYSFLEIRNEQLVKFDEIKESNDLKVSLGSISGNIGVEHYFSRRLSAQMELNYQYGLGKIGLEGRSFNSFAVSGGLFYKLNSNRRR